MSIEFGLGISPAATAGADPVADAVRAEELGFDFVSTSDHLHGPSPTFEPWTLLATIAARTSRLRVATRVLGLPYRHPAVIAKAAETLDRLSGGRLILGLGGGYSDAEFRAFGLGELTPRDKVDGLEEAVRVARGLWAGEPFSLGGRRYRLEDAHLSPKPGHAIPVWLGTYGNRALEVTGRLADGWIPSLGFAPPEAVVPMRARVLAAAEAAGRDPAEITCVYNVEVRVDDAATEADGVTGTADAVAEQLRALAELGFGGFNLIVSGRDAREQAERLATDVIPLVRDVG